MAPYLADRGHPDLPRAPVLTLHDVSVAVTAQEEVHAAIRSRPAALLYGEAEPPEVLPDQTFERAPVDVRQRRPMFGKRVVKSTLQAAAHCRNCRPCDEQDGHDILENGPGSPGRLRQRQPREIGRTRRYCQREVGKPVEK